MGQYVKEFQRYAPAFPRPVPFMDNYCSWNCFKEVFGASDPPVTSSKHLLGQSASLPEGGRLHVKIDGRYVTALRLKGKLNAIDSICYHAGGPLGIGEIEDVNGKSCLVCPWHHYKIDVATGEKYYQPGVWEDGKMKAGAWTSHGVQQRVHVVTEAEGNIYVTLSRGTNVDSDSYAFNVPCGDRMRGATNAPRNEQAMGADGRTPPSGEVLRNQAAGRGGSTAATLGQIV